MRPASNLIFVSFKEALQDFKELPSGHKIYLPSDLKKEHYATIIGTVHSVGDLCHDLKAGDVVACDYHVVANYDLLDDCTTIYRNNIKIGEDDVWRADEFQIMAKIVEGELIAYSDWIILEEIVDAVTIPSMGNLSEQEVRMVSGLMDKKVRRGCGKFLSGDLDIPKGMVAFFDEGYHSTYEINNKTYIFIKKYMIGCYGS